jgi:hypothetical protein
LADFQCICDAFCFGLALYEGTGEGGIRTLGSLLSYGALAKRCFQPLSHLTKSLSKKYREESGFSNLQFGLANTDFVAGDCIGVANCRLPLD